MRGFVGAFENSHSAMNRYERFRFAKKGIMTIHNLLQALPYDPQHIATVEKC
jgi:hypothetical protein